MITILVVEDEPAVLALVKEILGFTAYQVFYASSAAEGSRIAEKFAGSIHLLLANVILDGGKLGTELAFEVKLARPEMRVMLINGKACGDLAVLQHRCQIEGWQLLGKDFVAEDLLGRIRAELGGGGGLAAGG
jgi:DNA-binding response OmpR family regulator